MAIVAEDLPGSLNTPWTVWRGAEQTSKLELEALRARMLDTWSNLLRGLFPPANPTRRAGAPRIMAVMQDGPNRLLLEAVSKEAGWETTFSHPWQPVERLALAPIVFYERDLSLPDWPFAVRELTKRTPRPYLILFSPQVSSNLWDELERSGGSDVLRLPASKQTITSAVERAWRVWTNQESLRQPVLQP